MDLLLAEQALLIALDDVTGRDATAWSSEAGLAAALLLDLGERDLLRVGTDGQLTAADGDPPGHEVLREAYEAVRGSADRQDARGWVARLPGRLAPLHERLVQGLVQRGVLSEERSRVLGIFPVTRHPTADPGPERELRRRLVDVLVAGRAPTEEEALLVGLLSPLGLVDQVVPPEAQESARRRAEEIGRSGLAGTAVRDTVQELQTAVLTAAVIVPMIVTTGGS